MKKILATLLAAVMAFSMFIPAAAANTPDTLNMNDSTSAQVVFGVFGFLEPIYNTVHAIVHTLSEIFGFRCPFYHEKEDIDTPDNPDIPVDPVDPEVPVDDDTYEATEITAAELAELLKGEIIDNSLTVELNDNYVVTDDWTSISYPVDVYLVMLNSFTFKGNGHIIAGLTAPLFEGNVARNIKIENLTIANSNITNGEENGLGRGAIVAYTDSSVVSVDFENCTVKNTTVTSAKSAGALVGNAQQNNFSAKNCTVKGVNIDAAKSAGAVVGFFMTDSAMNHTIENCKVENCNLSGEYAGQIVGTANGSGELKIVNCDFSGDACDPARVFATVTVTND